MQKLKNIIATDASVNYQKADVGISSDLLDWSSSVRLPDFTPVFEMELVAIILALRKLPSDGNNAVIMTNFLSVCAAQTVSENSRIQRTFKTLIPPQLRLLRLLWVPGHCGITLNELADSLARAALDGLVLFILPDVEYITAIRYQKSAIFTDTIEKVTTWTEYNHLKFPWRPH